MRKVEGYGPMDAKLVIVGEAPGENEVREGRPFVGPAGKALRRWLMETGIDPDDARFENLVGFRPPKNRLASWFRSGQPTPLVAQGLMELCDIIEEIKPNLVLALGNFPMKLLTGKGYWSKKYHSFTGIQDYRGCILPSHIIPGQKVICSFHPAYLVREGMQDHGIFLADLARVKEDMQFPELRYPEKELYPNPQGHLRQQLRERLLDSPKDSIFTVDIEYLLNKKRGDGRLICVGITDSSDWAASFAVETAGDLEFVRELLLSGRGINMQNSMFDASILEWHYGIPIQRFLAYDTMLAAHASNIELPKSLDFLNSIYTRQPNHKEMINWADVKAGRQAFSDVYTYNCIDVWTQHAVMEGQLRDDLCDERARRVFEFEMSLIGPLWEVSKRGMRLDRAYMDELVEQLDLELVSLRHLLNSIAGRKINVKSNKDVPWLLHEFLGIECTRWTKTKNPATDDKTLAAYLTKCKSDREVATINLVRDIRNRRDLKSKFLAVKLDEDDRSRGHYDPSKTVTGRLASKKFYPTGRGHQQQNIPRDPRIRRCFIPDEGMEFGYADLERAESLVVAHICNDPLMLEHHAPGVDAHNRLAVILFDKHESLISKDERYLGKQTRHAGNYMQGAETMKRNINQKSHITGVTVSQSDCRYFIETYRNIHINLKPWWEEVERTLWQCRTIENLLGRYRIFYGHIGGIVPEAVAYNPQSTVGDTLNAGLICLHLGLRDEDRSQFFGDVPDYIRDHLLIPINEIKELSEALIYDWGWQMLNQVHDAVGYQFPIEHRYEVNSAVRKLLGIRLQSPKSYEDFVIPVEVGIGPSWGEVEVWEEDLHAQEA